MLARETKYINLFRFFLNHYALSLVKITFNKMAPVAFFFAAAGVKIVRHYFLVNGGDLFGYSIGIFSCE